ncbi:DMT family transporter [Tautonia sociabilis]|uniref:EamA/RhaT family transporter n=1 Tax=Tautonia sociabilis TaxID=2080755 RepID=A0A432MPM4_9BACT|nr:DMT family transporter [Tautonia sociabilis]RUL89046.1 EamA/RhaT family transporter [Tautonia sociabilis]
MPAQSSAHSDRAFGRRCVIAAAVLWSLSGVITKALTGLDGGSIAFYRGLFAGLALLPLVRPSKWAFRPAMLPLVVGFGAMTGLYIGAIKATTAANAIFLQYSAPIWAVPLSLLLLRERPDRRSLLGIAVAGLGILCIVVLGGGGGPNDALGIAMGLASGLGFAIVGVGLRFLRGLDPIWLSAINNLGGSIVLGLWLLASAGSIPIPAVPQAVVLFAFGVIQMAIPYVLFARGLRDIPAPEASLLALLEPVLNPIWVVLVIGEVPGWPTYVGGAFLLAGVVLRYVPTGRPRPAPPRLPSGTQEVQTPVPPS